MKILFVMDRRVDRGSIQAVANYVRAGDELGHAIALYGREDPRFPRPLLHRPRRLRLRGVPRSSRGGTG